MEKLYAAHTIENIIKMLERHSENVSEKSDLKKLKTRVINDFNMMELMAIELLKIIDNFTEEITRTDIQNLIGFINRNTNTVRYAENYKNIVEILNELVNLFGKLYWDLNMRNTKIIIDDIISGNKTLHSNLTVGDANKIIDNININREFNIFSPTAFDGSNLFRIKQSSKDKAITYGLERKDGYHANAKQFVNRMIKGQLQGSFISNQTFDMLQIIAPVSWVAEKGATGNLIERKEKIMVRNTIKYLRENGIFIYTLPITRITRDMAVLFSKALRDVQILTKEQDDLYIHIIGIKDIQSEVREDVYKLLTNVEINKRNSFSFEYNLPSGGIKAPEFFRGSVLDEEELISLVSNSGLKNSFWKSQEIEKEEDSARPLLPFNMGQIGLVLTSGCLDGLVKEYEGQYHAIKGMVTKVRNVEASREGQNETSIETISNKVQINLITPNGDFIELA